GCAGGNETVQPLLEATETREHAARHRVIEAEPTDAAGDRQGFWNDVEVHRGEEGELLHLAHLILVEGGVIALHTRILDGGAGDGADVRQTAGVARIRATRTARGARWQLLVHPRRLVEEFVVFPEGAEYSAQVPLIRGTEAQLILEMLVL